MVPLIEQARCGKHTVPRADTFLFIDYDFHGPDNNRRLPRDWQAVDADDLTVVLEFDLRLRTCDAQLGQSLEQ